MRITLVEAREKFLAEVHQFFDRVEENPAEFDLIPEPGDLFSVEELDSEFAEFVGDIRDREGG